MVYCLSVTAVHYNLPGGHDESPASLPLMRTQELWVCFLTCKKSKVKY